MKKMKRNANLDVLRSLAMFLIVLGHTYSHRLNPESSKILPIMFGAFVCWHVDAFLALSGWFGMRFSLKKFARLWCLIAFYSVVSILIGRLVMGVTTPIKIDGGWFGNTYLCLLLIVPLLNAGIEGLVAKGARVAWLAWLGFAIVIGFNWLSRNAYFGLLAYDVASFTLVQMVFVYFTVRLIRLTNVAERVRRWHIGLAFMVFMAGCLLFRSARTNYIAPYTIAMAIAVLILFERYLKFPTWLKRVCVWVAPSMFSVYLIHEVSSYGKIFHRMPVAWLTDIGVCRGGGGSL